MAFANCSCSPPIPRGTEAPVDPHQIDVAEEFGVDALSMDGTGLPVRASELQGRAGKQPDGSAKTREVKLVTLWTAEGRDDDGIPTRDHGSVTYSAAIESAASRDTDELLSAFAQRVEREARRRGFDRAQRRVVLGDGALWIWNMADELLPGAIQIVDLYHAKGYLSDVAKAIYGPASDLGAHWAKQRRDEVENGQIGALLEALRAHADTNDEARKCLDYVIRNWQRRRHHRLALLQAQRPLRGLPGSPCSAQDGRLTAALTFVSYTRRGSRARRLCYARAAMGSRSTPRVCVIGAGPSGLAAAKKLVDAGFDPLVYEQNAEVGGNWLFTGAPGHSSVLESTHIISSKAFSQYADYPMPADWPDYPSRKLLIEYFRGYARDFGLLPRIRLRTSVTRCEPAPDGGWRVATRGPAGDETRVFEHLLVANGHHWHPRLPRYEGTFSGRLLHSHDFKSARGFEARRVLVIGGGNSACDCAVELSRVAAFTAISLRRGYWFMPKFLLGQPNDVLYARLLFLPPRLRQTLMRLSLRLLVGPFSRYGLQEPDHDLLEAHPTLNSELLERLRHGDIAPRVDVERLEGSRVRFKDGRVEEYDAIVACTGYEIRFPFLDPGLVDYSTGDVPLYLRVFHPTLRGLYFIGLVQPLGCIWPLSELQGELVARVIAGRVRLPGDLEARAKEEVRRTPYRFVATPRHSVEVDYHEYSGRLRATLRST